MNLVERMRKQYMQDMYCPRTKQGTVVEATSSTTDVTDDVKIVLLSDVIREDTLVYDVSDDLNIVHEISRQFSLNEEQDRAYRIIANHAIHE